MPIYNETPARVFGALQAMFEDVEATRPRPLVRLVLSLRHDRSRIFDRRGAGFPRDAANGLAQSASIYYRHRPKNINRKAGNIEDFVTRWGGRYEHMVVLDADSLMTGDAIVALAAAMEADPDAGIIQTLPLIINRNTLFARVQQFAARIYGPVIAAGVSVWSGRDGNYWGHNAIIRTAAFAAHCGLPELRGRPPFGGHILSHDFVEAALIRRAGYAVYMLPTLGGSYEESPPSLIDLAARDRRWCQGNLQHLRMLAARKACSSTSRQHFVTGIMAYVASPLWMAQLLSSVSCLSFRRATSGRNISPVNSPCFRLGRGSTPRDRSPFRADHGDPACCPRCSVCCLPLSKARPGAAPAARSGSLLSAVFEIIMSALLAPIMMLIQPGHVMHFVFGFDTGWDPQRRDDGSIPFARHRRAPPLACRDGRHHLVAGL